MKLVKDLKAIETGQRRLVRKPLYTIDFNTESTEIVLSNYASEYSMKVTLGATQWINSHMIKQSGGKVIDYAVDHMKHAILEEVYGEFYRDLRELQFELRNELSYCESPSLKKIDEIMDKITL